MDFTFMSFFNLEVPTFLNLESEMKKWVFVHSLNKYKSSIYYVHSIV